MTDVVTFNGKSAYIDATLRANLNDMLEDIFKDDDIVLVIDGKERIGKSVLAQCIAWYVSGGTLTIKDICMTGPEFKERVENAPKNSVIIFDECYLGLASEDSMKTYNRLLKKMLVTIGQKNHFIILVLPSVFDLSKYVLLHRADCLLHCFKHKGQRGHFAYYSDTRITQLYVHGKKTYSYFKPRPNFARRFTNFYGVDEKEYREKKATSLKEFLSDTEHTLSGSITHSNYRMIQHIKVHEGLNNKEIAEISGYSVRTIQRALKWGDSRQTTGDTRQDTNSIGNEGVGEGVGGGI